MSSHERPSTPPASAPSPTTDLRVPARLAWVASITWRVLVIVAGVLVLAIGLARLRVVVIPVLVAIFAAVLLTPLAAALVRRGWRSLLATWTVFAGLAAVLVGLGWWIVPAFTAELDGLSASLDELGTDTRDWLEDGPLGLSSEQVDDLDEQVVGYAQDNASRLSTGAFAGARLAAEIVAGAIVALVLTFYFVKDSDRLGAAVRSLVPVDQHDDVRELSSRAVSTLRGYVVGVVADGLISSILIGLALWLLGVPLVVPLVVITFFGGFFPLVGAVVAGALAAGVALVAEGPVDALIVIGWSVFVQNIAANVVDPVIMSRAVRLHPTVVLVALTTGGILAGIPGAFLAVPLTAVGVRIADYYRHRDEGTDHGDVPIDGAAGRSPPPQARSRSEEAADVDAPVSTTQAR